MSFKTVGAIAVAAAAASGASLNEPQYQHLFSQFVEKYDKTYESNNFFQKYNTFKANIDHILTHNENNKTSYTLGVNQFADLTFEEFSKLISLNNDVNTHVRPGPAPLRSVGDDEDLPISDWTKVVRNPVKNQLNCGSCWAFSTVGAIEYIYALNRKSPVAPIFSEQQLVDCDPQSEGCSGGWMSWALQYLQRSGGLCTEADYPYTGRAGTCRDASCQKLEVPHYYTVKGGKPGMAHALAENPVSVVIAVSANFQFYSSGVFQDNNCSKTSSDHAVVAVGYGIDSQNGLDFIKLRNSWGAKWGEEGYMRMYADEKANTCGFYYQMDVLGVDVVPFLGKD